MRRPIIDWLVFFAAAVLVIAVNRWMVWRADRVAASHAASGLERVIDHVTIDLRSFPAALASLEKSAGVKVVLDRTDVDVSVMGLLSAERDRQIQLRRVSVDKAVRTVLEHFEGDYRFEYLAEGDVIRIRRERAEGEAALRLYDVRDLIENATEPSATNTAGSFSAPVTRPAGFAISGTVIGGNAQTLCRAILEDFAYDGSVTDAYGGGWIVVRASPEKHERIAQRIELLRMMR